MCSLLSCDDNEEWLVLLKLLINIRSNFKIRFDPIYTASNGREGFHLYQQILPDYVLTDFNMPFLNGRELLTKIYSSDLKKPINAWLMSNEILEEEKFNFVYKPDILNKV